jgi:hypothetical protein
MIAGACFRSVSQGIACTANASHGTGIFFTPVLINRLAFRHRDRFLVPRKLCRFRQNSIQGHYSGGAMPVNDQKATTATPLARPHLKQRLDSGSELRRRKGATASRWVTKWGSINRRPWALSGTSRPLSLWEWLRYLRPFWRERGRRACALWRSQRGGKMLPYPPAFYLTFNAMWIT